MSKVILTADVHYHKWEAFCEDGGRTRLHNISTVMRTIIDYAATSGSNNLQILGDVFEKRNPIDVEVFHTFMEDMKYAINKGVKVTILAGNHDQTYMQDAMTDTSLSIVNELNASLRVITTPSILTVAGVRILYVPYFKNHQGIEELINDNKDIQYCFGHFGIANAKLINSDFAIKAGVRQVSLYDHPSLKHVFAGHYHTPQTLEEPKCPPMTYIGSPLHHTFNDEGQAKSFIELDLATNTFTRIPTSYPEFITVRHEKNSDLGEQLTKPGFVRVKTSLRALNKGTIALLQEKTLGFTLDYTPDSSVVQEEADQIQDFDELQIFRRAIARRSTPNKLEVYNKAKEILKAIESL